MKFNEQKFIDALEREEMMYLATCADNHVTMRAMSHVNLGSNIYFIAKRSSQKAKQMLSNPNVAMCMGHYQIEGCVEFIGKVTEHPAVKKEFADKFKGAFTKEDPFHLKEDDEVIAVTITSLKEWVYENNKAVGIAVADLNQLH